MMSTRLTFLLLILVAASAIAGNDGGTTSPFAMGFGARAIALGGASIAGGSGATATDWNAAGLSDAERLELTGFHTRLYENGVVYQYVGLVWPTVDIGGFGLGVARLGIDGIEQRDNSNYLEREISDNRLGLYLAYGRHISGYRFGVTARLEHQALGDYSATSSPGLCVALGRTWSPATALVAAVRADLVARDLIRPGMTLVSTNVKQPTIIDVALAVDLTPLNAKSHWLRLAGKITKATDIDPRFSAGVEYAASDMMFLRVGFRDGRSAFGAGLRWGQLDFDYAWVDRDLGGLHMFTLSSSFGATVTERRQRRAQERASEFNQLMSRRWDERNQLMVGELVADGRQALADGDLIVATERLDRALFLARAANLDTLEIAELANHAQQRYQENESLHRFVVYLDSAQTRLAAGDHVMARHYAGLALVEQPNAHQALQIISHTTETLQATSARDSLIHRELVSIDSLMSYGLVEQASAKAEGLHDLAPDNEQVRSAIRRTRFEQLRTQAESAFSLANYSRVQKLLDSALTLLPGHRWGQTMQQRLVSARAAAVQSKPQPKPVVVRELDEKLSEQVQAQYQLGRSAFERGDLREAIAVWEQVEQLAPDYASVREYLVSAYKFVGVELYSENRLEEAVEVWRKAARVAPDNAEINNYLTRVENEIIKLRELSYEP